MKTFFAILTATVLLTTLASCNRTPRTAVGDTVLSETRSGPDTNALNEAVREASDYIVIEGGFPEETKILFLPVTAETDSLSGLVTDRLIADAVDDRYFTVADSGSQNFILEEMRITYSDEIGDATAIDAGRMLGAQMAVTGTFYPAGSGYRLTIRVVDVQNGRVRAQFSANVASR